MGPGPGMMPGMGPGPRPMPGMQGPPNPPRPLFPSAAAVSRVTSQTCNVHVIGFRGQFYLFLCEIKFCYV